MADLHYYSSFLTWTGNTGKGTENYRSYSRSYTITVSGKPEFEGSSDPHFRGDASKHNPEELLLMSLSSCHMLWYLHLCAENGIVVEKYADEASGTMETYEDGSGKFVKVILKPVISIKHNEHKELAKALHTEANKMCFIANSCNFAVKHEPEIIVADI